MTCEDRKDLLLLYAGDLLEPAERETLRAHLETGCPICAGNLAEAEAALALMATSIDPVAPPAGSVDRLMARIEREGSGPPGTRAEKSIAREPRRLRLLPSLLAAAAAIAITSGLWLYFTREARTFWNSKDLITVALASPTQPNAHGDVLWARDRGQWRVSVNNLGPTAAGREYELWLIPEGGAPIRSQTFRPASDGTATFIVSVPPSVGALATAAITDEPIGGTDAPTGKIHLAGKFR